jgi:serine/threonine protein phosphatase PrpC
MSGEDVQQCAKALIAATLQAGARDNVTVVVIEAQ